MKKYFTFFLFSIACFFFFGVSVSAESVILTDKLDYGRSPLGDDFTGEYFNFFYEKSQNSPIYNFLIESDLSSIMTFKNIYDYDFFYSIFTIDEIRYFNDMFTFNYLYNNMLTYNADYVVIKVPMSYFTLVSNSNHISFDFSNFSLFFYEYILLDSSANIVFQRSIDNVDSYTGDHINIFTDSYKFYYTWNNKKWYEFWKSDSYTGTDYSLFLSKVFDSSDNFSYSGNSIPLFGAIINNRITNSESFNSSNGLEYFNKFPVISPATGLRSLKTILSYSNVLIPYSPTSFLLNNYNGVLFIPKIDSTLLRSDYFIYMKADDSDVYFEKHTSFDFSNFYNWSRGSFEVPKSLTYYDFNISYEGLTSSDTTYAFYLEPLSYIDNIYFNYNSDAYDVYFFDSDTDTINYNGSDISFTDFKSNLLNYYSEVSSNNLQGVSCPLGTYFDTELEACSRIGEGSGHSGFVNDNNAVEEFNVGEFITGAWSGASTFISSSLAIVVLSVDFLHTLPAELYAMVLLFFNLGLIIILWKIFRG